MPTSKRKVVKKEIKIEDIEVEPTGLTADKKESTLTKKKYFRDAHRKPWRLIIRNLPFKTKKEDLQVACSRFGPFTEIVLPKCRDERYPDSCAGFAFVQFKVKRDAIRAMEELNLSELNGRKIAVDWAIDKDTYETASYKERQKLAGQASKVKQEPLEENDVCSSGSAEITNSKKGKESGIEYGEANSESQKQTTNENQILKQDGALMEGRVIFVRNLSYETEDTMLRKAAEKFGTIDLAIICRYGDSNHSKGTGFVHFATRNDADRFIAALENEPGIFVKGRRLYGQRAVSRDEATTLEKEKLVKKPKDKRNLYLLRLGIVRPGTAAAKGMSDSDAQKRTRLALAARQKLNNLHMFVSPTRLVVHNLPLSLSDKALRSICFLAAGNAEAKIVECRIWRDKQVINKKGIARSKGFGFVAFSQHKDAVNCLKQLNNNPETFSDEKRPIVEFSIENLSALRLKENRLKKSKQKQDIGNSKDEEERNRRDVEETKRALAAGGQKPLPSHFGPKIRKRGMKQTPVLSRGKYGGEKNSKRKVPMDNKQPGVKKQKLSKSKQLTKYLALS